MRSALIETLLLCGIAVCAPLFFGWISAEDLEQVLVLLLVWAAASTVLVGTAGAWVAIARSLRARAAGNARAGTATR